MAVSDIILGEGTFWINGLPIGLTRGGGQFTVEREYRMIEADGDFGVVKGRVRKARSTAKLTLNALELSPLRLQQYFPSTTYAGGEYTATTDVEDTDFMGYVKFVGKTKNGTGVSIQLTNAINLENLDLSMIDKEEIVASITFTAAYTEDDRTTEPWTIIFA